MDNIDKKKRKKKKERNTKVESSKNRIKPLVTDV